jgi:hypothetical protein
LTANELLALLGRAWPRLLIYPGGLAAFGLIWLIERTKNKEPRTENREPRTGNREPRTENREPQNRRTENQAAHPLTRSPAHPSGRWSVVSGRWSALEASAIVLPWLGLALLPLPRAAGLSRQIDLVAALALLEWPLLLAVAAELRDGADARVRAARRLAAALNSYPPLILAALVLASAYGSLETMALARPPEASTPARAALLHWLGASAWLLALPPALGIGAFAAGPPTQRALRLGLRLRALGLVALAALPWFALVAGPDAGGQGGIDLTWIWLPLPPLGIAALLWGYSRLTAGRSARGWAHAYQVLDAALLLVLLWVAYNALQARLA